MLIFRAVNKDDMNNYNKGNNINCSLANSYYKIQNKNTLTTEDKKLKKYYGLYFNLCLLGNREFALDTVTGHLNGEKLRKKTSPWISTASSFDIVAEEYSIPQAGRYNFIRERKPIIVIDMPDFLIKSDAEEIKSYRNISNIYDFCLDLRNGNANNLFNNEAILAEKYNIKMPGYDPYDDTEREDGKKTVITGLSNFATGADEILVFALIRRKYIKAVLSPELVDILYSCKFDIEHNLDFIINNYEKLNKDLKQISNEFVGKNLTDYLINKYNSIPGTNIEEKYEWLKSFKLETITTQSNYLNAKYNINLEPSRVLDNEVYVRCYENINNLSKVSKNDLIIIEKDKKIYIHDFDKKGYYNQELDSTITTDEVKSISSNNKCKVKTLSSQ